MSATRRGVGRLPSLLASAALLGACVSTPVEPGAIAKTWQPAVNDRGISVAQAQLGCRQAVIESGYDSVVLQQTLVGVCMRGGGFELK